MHALAESIRASIIDGESPDLFHEVGYEGESEMKGRYLLRVHASPTGTSPTTRLRRSQPLRGLWESGTEVYHHHRTPENYLDAFQAGG